SCRCGRETACSGEAFRASAIQWPVVLGHATRMATTPARDRAAHARNHSGSTHALRPVASRRRRHGNLARRGRVALELPAEQCPWWSAPLHSGAARLAHLIPERCLTTA